MKLKLQNLLFLFLLGAIGAKAQGPVITAAGNAPQIGDSYKWQNANSILINPSSFVGANKVWDFSNIKDSGATDIISFVSPKGYAYADSFQNYNLVSIYSSDTTYVEFDKTDSSGWGQMGSYNYDQFLRGIYRYTPRLFYMRYPMTINSNYTYSFQSYQNDGGVSFNETDTFIGIGYGTLKLPNATYNNVVCVYNSGNYLFVANGFHFALLELGIDYNSPLWAVTYSPGTTLPLQISSFTAAWQNKTPFLQWSAANTENTKQFNIQRSIDSKNFVTVGQVGVNGGSAYHFQDNTAPNTTVYYRLQQVDKNGATFYSSTARLTVNGQLLTVFPNPAKGAIHLTIPATSQAQVFVYDVAGRLVYQNKSYTATNTIATDSWSKGTYTIRLKDNDGWKVSSFEKE